MQSLSRILVVDDRETNLDMLSRRLSRSGYAVETAKDGPEALQVVAGKCIDLVLLDQMMPGMTGLEVLCEIRKTLSPQQLPVIMVTAVTEGSAIAEALDSGANDYVTKPLDFQVALARIRIQLDRGRVHSELRQREERYALAARGTGEGVWDWDLVANKVYFSPELYQLLGMDSSEAVYHPEQWFARVHPAHVISLRQAFAAKDFVPQIAERRQVERPDNTGIRIDFRMMHGDGKYRWVSLQGVTLYGEDGAASRRVGSIVDTTKKMTTDDLTGLASKLVLAHDINGSLDARTLGSPRPFAVYLFDVDRFKLIRSSVGEAASELLLQQVAQRAQQTLTEFFASHPESYEPHVTLAHLNGDEFALSVDPILGWHEAKSLAERMVRAMRPAFPVQDREIFCSISVGVVLYEPSYRSAEEMLRDANTARLAAETRGTSQWMLFEPSMRHLHDVRLQMDIDLRLALERQEFEVFYQSRVHLQTGKICGFEALVRWNHPTRGLVPPIEFIPLAEENGLVHELGLWVLRQACTQLQQWRETYSMDDEFEISVNLSALQCREAGLVEQVSEILQQTGLPASSLNLELTESLLLENLMQAKNVLTSLKSLGVGLKLDDFGTGYSCLKYLCEFPFDSLKIDRSFTADLNQNNADTEEIVRTIVQMAANLKMEVVAEGIENPAHVARLGEMGCEFGQGYFFSRPINAAAAEAMLKADVERHKEHMAHKINKVEIL